MEKISICGKDSIYRHQGKIQARGSTSEELLFRPLIVSSLAKDDIECATFLNRSTGAVVGYSSPKNALIDTILIQFFIYGSC